MPLRLEELMYEAFTLTRNFKDSATKCVLLLLAFALRPSKAATPLRSSSNSRIYTHLPGPHPTSCASPFRSHAAQRPRACSYVPSVVENEACRLVGGVCWWQVRPGDSGLYAEWVMNKRDWKEAKRGEKAAAAG